MFRLVRLLCLVLLAVPLAASAQQPLPSLTLLGGLRSSDHQGGFKAAAYLPGGAVILLYDQGDGLRLLKADAALSTVLAEAHLGARGDNGVALCVSSAGVVYVGGTSSSGNLSGTPASAFPLPADPTLNSFVAAFDSDLNRTFLTFLGAGNTELTGLSVAADSIFAAGLTYSDTLPATAGSLQPIAASGSYGNGFVERLSKDGSRLEYATYLSGADGATAPSGIVADSAGNAYIAGYTSSAAFPVVNALQPFLLGNAAGFLLKLTPAGDQLTFSTFLAGNGISSLALTADEATVLVSGDISSSWFPIAAVAAPLVPGLRYGSLLRLGSDGRTLLSSTLLPSGLSGSVTVAADGGAWVTGTLDLPLTSQEQHAGPGLAYAAHIPSSGVTDRFFRMGGNVTANLPYAAFNTLLGPAALNAEATSVLLPATVALSTDPTLVGGQSYVFGTSSAGPLFPVAGGDLLPSSCAPDQPCAASAAVLGRLDSTPAHPLLSISSGDLPLLVVQNQGSAPATGLRFSSSTLRLKSNCPDTLAPETQCSVALGGAGAGQVILTADNAPSQQLSFNSNALSGAVPLALSASELDFGIVSAAAPVSRTVTLTNLGAAPLMVSSRPVFLYTAQSFSLTTTATTCSGAGSSLTLQPNDTCTVTITLTASSSPRDNGKVRAGWSFSNRELAITAATQAASLAVSSTRIDFGPQLASATARLPRFLHLSNLTTTALVHASLTSAADSPFVVTDLCPSLLAPLSVCQIRIDYRQTTAPSLDTQTLTLDQGLAVLLTGSSTATLPAYPPLPASPLTVSSQSVQFANPVLITTTSDETARIQITNTAAIAVPLQLTLLGDFQSDTTCGASLQPAEFCTVTLHFAPLVAGLRLGALLLRSGSAFQTREVALSGTAEALLPDTPTIVDFGETTSGEPVVRWLQIPNAIPSLSITSADPNFTVALRAPFGNGHPNLPASAFSSSVTGPCYNCWLGLQFFPHQAGTLESALHLATTSRATYATLMLRGTALTAEGLQLSPAAVRFDAIPVGSTSTTATVTLTNLLDSAQPVLLKDLSTSGDFHLVSTPQSCASALPAGASCSIDVTFTPSALGPLSGSLTIATGSGTLTAPLSGTGTPSAALALNPVALTFSGAGQATLTVTNRGASTLLLAPPFTSNAAFSSSSACTTLQPQAHCSVTVTYTPQASATSAFLGLPVSSGDPASGPEDSLYSVPLTLAAPPAASGLALFPARADFGPLDVHTTSPVRQFVLTNTSPDPVTLTVSGSRNFPLASPADCGLLASGASCTISALFQPEVGGSQSGVLTVTALRQDGTFAAQITAELQGFSLAHGTLTLSGNPTPDAALDFGALASGEKASTTLRLTNSGSSALALRRLVTSPPFSVASSCGLLDAGSSCDAVLTYSLIYSIASAPSATTAPRIDSGTLIMESDADTTPDTVGLTGTVSPRPGSSDPAAALPTYTLSSTALTFPDTSPGTSSPAQTITLLNSGTVPLQIDDLQISPGFVLASDCHSLEPGTSCTLSLLFLPKAEQPDGVRTGLLTIRSNAADARDFVSLLGYAASEALDVGASVLRFPATLVGSNSQLALELRNTTTFPLSLGEVAASGDFSIAPGSCPAAGTLLAPGESCALQVTFAPKLAAQRTGTLTLHSAARSQDVAVPLTGLGIAGHLEADLAAIDFGIAFFGSTVTRQVQLTNTGTAPLTDLHLSFSGPDQAAFTQVSGCGSLEIRGSCTATVGFTAFTSGPHTAALVISSSDPSGPTQIALTAAGDVVPGFALSLPGGSSQTVSSGQSAQFPFRVTPSGGYTAPVNLACAPVAAAPNALCTLSSTVAPLSAGPVNGSLQVSTLSGLARAFLCPLGMVTLALFGPTRIRSRRSAASLVLGLLTALLAATGLLGCGGGSGSTGSPYTPPGVYSYRLTASSSLGTPVRSSIVVTVTVR